MLGEVVRAIGLNPTEKEINKIVDELVSSGSKRMSFEEFFPIYQSLRTAAQNAKERRGTNANKNDFMTCLRVFDHEQNGRISVGELQHVITQIGEGLSTE